MLLSLISIKIQFKDFLIVMDIFFLLFPPSPAPQAKSSFTTIQTHLFLCQNLPLNNSFPFLHLPPPLILKYLWSCPLSLLIFCQGRQALLVLSHKIIRVDHLCTNSGLYYYCPTHLPSWDMDWSMQSSHCFKKHKYKINTPIIMHFHWKYFLSI